MKNMVIDSEPQFPRFGQNEFLLKWAVVFNEILVKGYKLNSWISLCSKEYLGIQKHSQYLLGI